MGRNNSRFRRRGQAFFIEFGFAVLAVAIAAALLVKYSPFSSQETSLQDVAKEARRVSASLISRGYPPGWTPANAQRIGLTNGKNDVNETKVSYYANMSYGTTKSLLGARHDYIAFFENRSESIIIIEPNTTGVFGKPGENKSSVMNKTGIEAMVRVERVVALRGDVARLVVYVWKEE